MARLDDIGRQLADESLEALEKRYKRIYRQAAREMRKKQQTALRKYQNELSELEKALDNTKEAMAAHKAWLQAQAADQAWVNSMAEGLAVSATAANELATAALNDTIPKVFADSANFAAFAIDKAAKVDTSFALLDASTVRRLQMTGEPLLKEVTFPRINRPKDIRWNRQRFASAIIQGILQGESIPRIVRRTDSIYGSNMAAAMRAARTATTNAENAGRMSSLERAAGLGIEVKQRWMATLDERTREEHRQMDGEEVEVGERFSNGLRFPGDPFGAPEEVWNCRCTLTAAVDGVGNDGGRWSKLPEDMTYDEWRDARAKSAGLADENKRAVKGRGWLDDG